MKKVTIPLDVERELKYSLNAIVELEERFNAPVTELFKESRIGLGLIRAVVYIGLKHGGMKLASRSPEEAVGELIQEHWLGKGRTLNELVEVAMEAFKAAGVFSETQEEETPQENPTQ